MATTLEVALLYLVAAVLGVVACRMLKLPPMLGYLAVGVLIGPNALALARDSAGVKYLAEFGVVFLMFVIGLEFNLPKLRSMRTLVFGLGSAQVVLTIAGALTGASLLPSHVSQLVMHRFVRPAVLFAATILAVACGDKRAASTSGSGSAARSSLPLTVSGR